VLLQSEAITALETPCSSKQKKLRLMHFKTDENTVIDLQKLEESNQVQVS